VKRFIIVGIVIFIVLAYLVTYRVRFTETAVKTTFGEASQQAIDEPGLRFIVPYVQDVVKYDKRARYLESRPETVQTKDARQVVVTAYLTWKVEDPKKFFQVFSHNGERAVNHYRGAERVLSDRLRGAMGQISQFRFDELVSSSSGGSRLADCEKQMLAYIAGTEADSLTTNYGATPVSVGIVGMELPQETTSKVFEAMQTNRKRIANDAIAQGRARAQTIRSTAENDARTILQFAESRAARIRAEGIREAQKYIEQLQKEPELAVFIRNMELMKDAFGNNRVTLLIPGGPNGWPGFQLFQPSFMDELKSGKLPSFMPPGPGQLRGALERAPAEPGAGSGEKGIDQ
jgi:membrane protease subunit HflC